MKQRTRVKICGITRVEDALAAAAMGADAIGLVFYDKSPRHIEIEQAAEICRQLPAFVTTAGLFLDAEPAAVNSVLEQVSIDLLQFHGAEDPAYCDHFDRPYIKALAMGSLSRDGVVDQAKAFERARGLLLDSHSAGAAGGTGDTFDWSGIPELDRPVILAGGLNVSNVAAAIDRVRPWAVDVSSGVEADKGIKSVDLMSAFMREVGNADE